MLCRPAIEELEVVVYNFLSEWEDSDALPSEASRELVEIILANTKLAQAMDEFLSLPRHTACAK